MENSKVSIIIPLYNAEQYIEKCLRSIMQQTYQNLEIIVVDDLSSDNGRARVEKIVLQDSRVQLIGLQENVGPALARQKGLDVSTGEYITFVDADDWYNDLNAVKTVVDAFARDDLDCVMFGYRTIHPNYVLKKALREKERLYTASEAFLCKTMKKAPHWHYLWNKFYQAKVIKENGISFCGQLRNAEDVRFNKDFLRIARNIKVLGTYCCYDYNCCNVNQVTRRKTAPTQNEMDARFWWVQDELHESLEDCDCFHVSAQAKRFLYTEYYKAIRNLLFSAQGACVEVDFENMACAMPEYRKAVQMMGGYKIFVDMGISLKRQINQLKRLLKNILKG